MFEWLDAEITQKEKELNRLNSFKEFFASFDYSELSKTEREQISNALCAWMCHYPNLTPLEVFRKMQIEKR